MRILVMTPETDAVTVVKASFQDDEGHLAWALNEAGLLAADDQGCLRAFWQAIAGARIVVLSPQRRSREAVSFVRGGASPRRSSSRSARATEAPGPQRSRSKQ
jgi:hypothetical protein